MLRAALLLLITSGCSRPAPPPAAPAQSLAVPQADTLRGRIEVVGSEPGTSVALLLDGGARAVTLRGERPLLDRLAALEVTVWGRPLRAGEFDVERVVVRAADGVPAEDGVLAREGGGWVLVTQDGRRLPIARLPEALQGRAGTRVWITGPLDRALNSFGVIRP
jgi:hypothetical protein